ncbi:hypothetical protein ccbrp13_01750 [Ktedonobacteria bacterium brp13]|nr:hypothetical protein ccbrp13_01750 [Ktedonobacteria bacterium brp13]
MAAQVVDFDMALDSLSQSIAAKLGVDRALVKKLEQLEIDSEALVPFVHISTNVNVPISNGYGTYLSPRQTSWWRTFHGNAAITAPNDGTSWTIVAIDVVQNKTIFSGNGLVVGQKIPFSYKTGFNIQIKVDAQCSNPQENTTLVIHLDGDA